MCEKNVIAERSFWLALSLLALIAVGGFFLTCYGCADLAEKGATERTRITGKRFLPVKFGGSAVPSRESPVEEKDK